MYVGQNCYPVAVVLLPPGTAIAYFRFGSSLP